MTTIADRLFTAAMARYFDMSYRLLTRSDAGARFLELSALAPGVLIHGYATPDDLDALVRFLAVDEAGSWLDLGCGVGGVTLELHRRTGRRIVGIDLSEEALRSARHLAPAVGASGQVSFVRASIGRPPRFGASAAYALDSLMFVPLSTDVLRGIRDALAGPGRLVTTFVAFGREARDPVVAAADAVGVRIVASEDVTPDFIRQGERRLRIARHVLRRGPWSASGLAAMALVLLEESVVSWLARAGRMRRWRTVVDLGAAT
ncbi:MAG: class I SAM-dependent methyltransferase [Chloroflexi bacterium]|nr:class I SAM-dependent methyltransferase [Chloroflexota bacterium]